MTRAAVAETCGAAIDVPWYPPGSPNSARVAREGLLVDVAPGELRAAVLRVARVVDVRGVVPATRSDHVEAVAGVRVVRLAEVLGRRADRDRVAAREPG